MASGGSPGSGTTRRSRRSDLAELALTWVYALVAFAFFDVIFRFVYDAPRWAAGIGASLAMLIVLGWLDR